MSKRYQWRQIDGFISQEHDGFHKDSKHPMDAAEPQRPVFTPVFLIKLFLWPIGWEVTIIVLKLAAFFTCSSHVPKPFVFKRERYRFMVVMDEQILL